MKTLAGIALALALLFVGCGSDKPKEIDSQAVQKDVRGIVGTCLTKAYDKVDPTKAPTDDSSISPRVNRLIKAYKANPDAKLKGVQLKTKTIKSAMEGAASILDDCKPEDARRINEALTE